MNRYYFVRISGYCGCCTFHYKTYVVKASSEEELKKLILQDEKIRNKLFHIHYSTCRDNGDTCQDILDGGGQTPMYGEEICRCGTLYAEGLDLSFFSSVGGLKSVEAMIRYYSAPERNILDEINNFHRKNVIYDYQLTYYGPEEQARESLIKEMPAPTENNGLPTGEIIFKGLKFYPDLDHTMYGLEELN